jgi:thymidylate synthase
LYVRADTLDDAMRRTYRRLLTSGKAISPSRGDAVEIVGALIQLTNPRARLSRTESRGRLFSALGELLWYLAKTDALPFIAYYIPEYSQNSDDGRVIHGAYGPRLFTDGGVNQVANVISLLRKRPDSRRAVIQLFRSTDIPYPYRDVPCTCSLQFLLRSKRLDLVATMRSNDVFLGFPHDVFAFTMLQELIARSVGAEVGQYHHMVGSLHLYDTDRSVAWRYLREGWQRTKAMPSMPTGLPWASVQRLLAAERAIRKGHRPKTAGLAPYWKDLIRLLQIFRASKQGDRQVVAELKTLMASPVYRPYIDARLERAESGRQIA